MKPLDIEILQAFRVCGSMTCSDLLKMRPDLCDEQQLRAACERLYASHHLNAQRFAGGKPPIYEIAAKARRLLSRHTEVELGDIPQPRTYTTSEPYVPKPIATRPGSQDFLACPSLRGETRVPHALPISMAGGEA